MFLAPLAYEICRRYRAEFPDEQERYGDAGIAWCVHDTQYLLAWAVLDLDLKGHFAESVTWLARLLAARDFPLDRLARDLELAAEAVDEEYGAKAKKVVAVLRSGVPLVERSARSVEE